MPTEDDEATCCCLSKRGDFAPPPAMAASAAETPVGRRDGGPRPGDSAAAWLLVLLLLLLLLGPLPPPPPPADSIPKRTLAICFASRLFTSAGDTAPSPQAAIILPMSMSVPSFTSVFSSVRSFGKCCARARRAFTDAGGNSGTIRFSHVMIATRWWGILLAIALSISSCSCSKVQQR